VPCAFVERAHDQVQIGGWSTERPEYATSPANPRGAEAPDVQAGARPAAVSGLVLQLNAGRLPVGVSAPCAVTIMDMPVTSIHSADRSAACPALE